MPNTAYCYLCSRAADTTPPPGEAPLCRRCVESGDADVPMATTPLVDFEIAPCELPCCK